MKKLFLRGVAMLIGLSLGIVLLGVVAGIEGASERRDAEARTRKELNLTYGFSEGWLISHDFYVTNTSGEDLSGVHLTFVFFGENASPTIDRYWASWPLGTKQHIEIPTSAVTKVQRITVSGRADQGVVEADLATEK